MYRVHLKREEIFEAQQGGITLKEFINAIKADTTLEYTNSIKYASPFGENIIKSGGHYFIWKAPKTDVEVYFEFDNGIISVVFCKETLSKLKEWSAPLKAYIYGDTGEEY